MKLVAVCGPHAAGKNDVAKRLFEFFGGDILERVVPCTTRPPRPGELHGREYFFIKSEEFEVLHQAGKFVFDVTIRDSQRSGTLKSELLGKKLALVDVVPQGARLMRDLIVSRGGQALLVFVHASERERRKRIKVRDPQVSDEQVERMILHDPVSSDLGLYSDFDLVIENPDGCIDQTVFVVISAIKSFLNI